MLSVDSSRQRQSFSFVLLSSTFQGLMVLSICMVRRYVRPALARRWHNFLACSTYSIPVSHWLVIVIVSYISLFSKPARKQLHNFKLYCTHSKTVQCIYCWSEWRSNVIKSVRAFKIYIKMFFFTVAAIFVVESYVQHFTEAPFWSSALGILRVYRVQ